VKYSNFSKDHRKNHRVVSSPAQVGNLRFEDLYNEISDHWEDKARRLQARRWRKIRHQAI